METIEINQGAIENFVIQDTEGYSVVMLVAEDKDSPAIFVTDPALFVEGEAQIELTGEQTDLEVGDYIYEFRIFDEDGNFENLNRGDCYGEECGFGKLTICPSIIEGSS